MICRLVSHPLSQVTALAFRGLAVKDGLGCQEGSANCAKLRGPHPALAVATVSVLATVGNSWRNILRSAILGHSDKYSNQQLHI